MVPGAQFPALSSRFLVLSSWFSVLGSRFSVSPGSGVMQPDCWSIVPATMIQRLDGSSHRRASFLSRATRRASTVMPMFITTPLKSTNPTGHWIESAVDSACIADDIWTFTRTG
jgi:hypothetical protein